MGKSPDAFRTISEVAEWLDTQAHVLRFWESKFTQVKPVKRAGGRRYYRPQDMLLLGGIKTLLHDDGMTIKGAQKLLREKGVKYVSGLSQPLEGDEEALDIASDTDDDSLAHLETHRAPSEVEEQDYLPEDDSAGAPEEYLPEDDDTAEDEDLLPEDIPASVFDARPGDPDDDADDDLDDALIAPAAQPTSEAETVPAEAPEDDAPEAQDEDLPPSHTIPAFVSRVSSPPPTDDAEVAETEMAHAPEAPAPAQPATPAQPPADLGDAAPETQFEDLLRLVADTSRIAPEHRAQAATLVAQLATLHARAQDPETA